MAIQFWEVLGRYGLDEKFQEQVKKARGEKARNGVVNGEFGYRLSLLDNRHLHRLLSRPGVEFHLRRLGEQWRDAKGSGSPSEELHRTIGLMCIDTDFRKKLDKAKSGSELKKEAEELNFRIQPGEADTLYQLLVKKATLEKAPPKVIREIGQSRVTSGLEQSYEFAPEDSMIIVESGWSPPPNPCDARMIFPKKKFTDLADIPAFPLVKAGKPKKAKKARGAAAGRK